MDNMNNMDKMNMDKNEDATDESTSSDGSNVTSPLPRRAQEISPLPCEMPGGSTPCEATTKPSEPETSDNESLHSDSASKSVPSDPSSRAAKAILETLAALARHSPHTGPVKPDDPAKLAGLAALARHSALTGPVNPANPVNRETSTDSTARAARLVLAALTDFDVFTAQPKLIENPDSDDPAAPLSRAVLEALVDPSKLSPLIGSAIYAAHAVKTNPTACNDSSTPADLDENDIHAALAALKVLVGPAYYATLRESADPNEPAASSDSNIRATVTNYYTRGVQSTPTRLRFLSRTRVRPDPAAYAAFAVITAFRSLTDPTAPTGPVDLTEPINRAALTVITTLATLADPSCPANSAGLDLRASTANFADITELDDKAVPPACTVLAALVDGIASDKPTDAAICAACAILAALSTVADLPPSEDRIPPTSTVTQFVYPREDRNLNFHSASVVVVKRERSSLTKVLLTLDALSLILVGLVIGCLAVQGGTIIGKFTPLTDIQWEKFSFAIECTGFGSYILVTVLSTLRYILYSIPVFTELGIPFVLLGIFYAVLFGFSYESWTAEVSHHILRTREGFMWIAIVLVVLHFVCLFVPMSFPHHGYLDDFTVYAHQCMAKSVLHELEPTNPRFNLSWQERGGKLFVFNSEKLNMEQGSGGNTKPVRTMLLLQQQVKLHIQGFETPAPDICMSRKQLFEETYRAYLYLNTGFRITEEATQQRINAGVQQLKRPREGAILYNQLSWYDNFFI